MYVLMGACVYQLRGSLLTLAPANKARVLRANVREGPSSNAYGPRLQGCTVAHAVKVRRGAKYKIARADGISHPENLSIDDRLISLGLAEYVSYSCEVRDESLLSISNKLPSERRPPAGSWRATGPWSSPLRHIDSHPKSLNGLQDCEKILKPL